MVFLAERRPTTAEMSLARGSNLEDLGLRPSWSSLKLNEETLVIYLANFIMGYCEAVTHRTLTPAFEGSNPSTPAIVAKNIAILYVLASTYYHRLDAKNLVNMDGCPSGLRSWS